MIHQDSSPSEIYVPIRYVRFDPFWSSTVTYSTILCFSVQYSMVLCLYSTVQYNYFTTTVHLKKIESIRCLSVRKYSLLENSVNLCSCTHIYTHGFVSLEST